MKKTLSLIITIAMAASAFAQAPQKMSYQAVVRDNSGMLLSNSAVGMQVSILQGSSTGVAVYVETHSTQTNTNGLVSVEIGDGTVVSGNFSNIDWAVGPYFIRTETDPTGGNSYSIIGNSQLLSVPYALYAENSGGGGSADTTVLDMIIDADEDTKVTVEDSPNENVIRFNIAGTEKWAMNGTALESVNSGLSVFIGEDAGYNDDLSDNKNVLIGYRSGYANTTGSENTALGFNALFSNTDGTYNTATGGGSLYSNNGFYNTANGFFALNANTTGSKNTATGFQSLSSATTADNNTAYGHSSLQNNTIGSANTATGSGSMFWNTTGSQNTATGHFALDMNTSGNQNSAFGDSALYSNEAGLHNSAFGASAMYGGSAGSSNSAFGWQAMHDGASTYSTAIGARAMHKGGGSHITALGYAALYSNTTGNYNTASGYKAMYENTTGYNNSGYGYQAMKKNTTGRRNVAIGYYSMYENTTGYSNTAVGNHALRSNKASIANTAIGYEALRSCIEEGNTAVGYHALYSDSTGYNNVAVGKYALNLNLSGDNNTAVGKAAMTNNTTGSHNVALGRGSLKANTAGDDNVAIGAFALESNLTGSNNTAIGDFTGLSITAYNNTTSLGNSTTTTASNQVRLGNGSVVSIGGSANWTNVSDARFKVNVQENVKGLEFISSLRPVTYNIDVHSIEKFFTDHYGIDPPTGIPGQYTKENIRFTGFIAQEVEQAARSLNYDFSGVDAPDNENDFYGLRYAEFVVPLVKAVQELTAQNETLLEQLKAQQADIELLKNSVNGLQEE